MNTSRLSITEYHNGILNRDTVILAKAITLIESTLPKDQLAASELIDAILQHTGRSIRIGITGVPGVGKSTFIEAYGRYVTSLGKKIAVLTVDPSSQLTKGSILGDKTRMEELSKNPLAFIRPSPSGNTLGGVAGKTRETILLCEAAGFEIILIETVGVGQSEVAVKNMVDFFLLLMLAGAGDELQGIKKGIMEMADAVVITKADGDNMKQAALAQADFQHALHLSSALTSGWSPQVITCSALTTAGIEDIWKIVLAYKNKTLASGYFKSNRQKQIVSWFHEYFDHLLRIDFDNFAKEKGTISTLEEQVSNQKISPHTAARKLLLAYRKSLHESKS